MANKDILLQRPQSMTPIKTQRDKRMLVLSPAAVHLVMAIILHYSPRRMKMTKSFLVFSILILLLNCFASCDSQAIKDANSPRPQLLNRLQGKEIRVVAGHFPTLISVLRNSTGHVVGYSDKLYTFLLYLARKLKFTYTIFPAAENSNGVKRNGTWNGIIGTISRDEADLGLVPMAISLERYEAIEFCGYIGGDSTGILVKYPPGSASFTSTVDVFSIEVWIGWIASGVVIVAVSIFLTFMVKRLRIRVGEINSTRPGILAWYLYGTIISQGGNFPFRHLPQKLLAATWCLVAFVFVNIYNSTLTSYLSVTYQKPDINSFRELATATSYKATVIFGSIQEIDLSLSNNADIKMIYDRIKKCSSDCRKFGSQELAEPVLAEKNYVSILPTSIGFSFMKQYNTKQCRLTMAQDTMSWRPMFLAVSKSFPYTEEINRESLWYFNFGLTDYGKKDMKRKQCLLNYNSQGFSTKRSSNRIKLELFYLPFLILFIGYFLAFVQFLREKFIHCPVQRSSNGTVRVLPK